MMAYIKTYIKVIIVAFLMLFIQSFLMSQSNNVEQLLIEFRNKNLGGVDYNADIKYPYEYKNTQVAAFSFVVSLGSDIAAIVTFGASEKVRTTVKFISYTGKAANYANKIVQADDMWQGLFDVESDIGTELLIQEGEIILNEGKKLPFVRTGVSIVGLYSAVKKDKEELLADISMQKELLQFIGETGQEIITIQDEINQVGDSEKRKEYELLLSGMVQKKAELAVYRQQVKEEWGGNDLGKQLDMALDAQLGKSNPTINSVFVEMVNDFIDGGITEEEFYENLETEIDVRSGDLSFDTDVVIQNLQLEINEAKNRNEKINKYGGYISLQEQKLTKLSELIYEIPIYYRLTADYDMRSIPIELPDDFFTINSVPGQGTFLPEFVGTSNPYYQLMNPLYQPEVSSDYKPLDKAGADKIINVYKSIPGGITLEGIGKGLGEINEVIFDRERNIFIVNKEFIYQDPLRIDEMQDIVRAINLNDIMGVSLAGTATQIIYGELEEISVVSVNLKLADHFLGEIAFARNGWLIDYKYADNYKPKEANRELLDFNLAVYFNFCEFIFSTSGSRMGLSNSNLEVTLVPLSTEKSVDGGHLPDFEALEDDRIPTEYLENIRHITENIDYYMNEQLLRMVNAYGEMAAFARLMKKSGVNLNEISISENLK
ncbi:MAG: hypothetical protein KQI35_14275 [Bacteroidetes bacterium]|nr:hypothetical protein [Bacteroidota bacterium]